MTKNQPEMVTIRMSQLQKNELIAKAVNAGASLNQFVLMQLGLQDELIKVHAMRGRKPKPKVIEPTEPTE